MLTSAKVKSHALHSGADLVGIASPDRFAELPARFNPLSAFPEAKSVVVLGFRLFRGLYRGVQAGTFYTMFSMMGYAGNIWVFQPVTLWKFCNLFEDAGYEASPIPDNFPWSNIDGVDADEMGQGFIDANPAFYGKDSSTTAARADDRPAPDIYFQMRLAAYCRPGEIGDSGMFLTPEYGFAPDVRSVLTDAGSTRPIFPAVCATTAASALSNVLAVQFPRLRTTVRIAGAG